jgi:hypothetical protein
MCTGIPKEANAEGKFARSAWKAYYWKAYYMERTRLAGGQCGSSGSANGALRNKMRHLSLSRMAMLASALLSGCAGREPAPLDPGLPPVRR